MQSIALDFNQLGGFCIFTVLQKIKSKRGENPAFLFWTDEKKCYLRLLYLIYQIKKCE